MFNGETNVNSSFDSSSFMTKVYGLMSLSLLLSFATAFVMAQSGVLHSISAGTYSVLSIVALLVECVIIWFFGKIAVKNPALAITELLFFSVLDGATISIIFIAYPMKLIIDAFAIATILFACMSIAGLKTKKELNWGTQLLGATVGLIIVEIVELFIFNSLVYMVFAGIGVILFAGYTIYDSQKIKEIGAKSGGNIGVAAYGALSLYIDIMGLFEYVLSILGMGNNNN